MVYDDMTGIEMSPHHAKSILLSDLEGQHIHFAWISACTAAVVAGCDDCMLRVSGNVTQGGMPVGCWDSHNSCYPGVGRVLDRHAAHGVRGSDCRAFIGHHEIQHVSSAC